MNDFTSTRGAKALTVAELIRLLEEVPAPETTEAWADGCDCTNPVTGVALGGGSVTLEVDA